MRRGNAPPRDDSVVADARALIARTRVACGMPATVEDADVIARIAAVLDTHHANEGRRRRARPNGVAQ
jgi:hypothetical protein